MIMVTSGKYFLLVTSFTCCKNGYFRMHASTRIIKQNTISTQNLRNAGRFRTFIPDHCRQFSSGKASAFPNTNPDTFTGTQIWAFEVSGSGYYNLDAADNQYIRIRISSKNLQITIRKCVCSGYGVLHISG